MTYAEDFDPNRTYQKLPRGNEPVELFISPTQYIQGRGVIGKIGDYLALSISGRAGVLITPGRDRALGDLVEGSLSMAGLSAVKAVFQGESSVREVERVAESFRASGGPVNVVIGVLTQLILERRMDEARTAARFFKAVGLPLCLEQLGFDPEKRRAEPADIVRCALEVFFIRNEPFEVTPPALEAAIIEAGRFGKALL